jgi:hypothetical protein
MATPAARCIQGFLLCLVPVLLISAVSFQVHGEQSRLRDRVREALPSIESGGSSGDAWSDCMVLSGIVAPVAGLIEYAGSPPVVPNDPCPALHEMLVTGGTAGLGHYDRQWLGTIYLTTIGLGIFDLSTLRLIYRTLLVLAIACFGLAGFPRLAPDLRLAPALVAAGLLAGTGLERFGGDVNSAPGYFVPLFGLAAFLALSRGPRDAGKAAWLGSIIGTLSGYYDLLCGGIPLSLSLAILTTYLLWQNQDAGIRSVQGLIKDLAVVSVAFFLSVVALVALKLLYVTTLLGHANAIAEFKGELLWRTSEDGVTGTRLAAAAAVLAKLLGKAPPAFLFGRYGAVVTYVLGAVSWIAALLGAARRYAASRDLDAAARFIGPLLAAAVVPAWFMLFLSHGFIHAWFMTRIVCLVPSLGVAAAWMVFAQRARSPHPFLVRHAPHR